LTEALPVRKDFASLAAVSAVGDDGLSDAMRVRLAVLAGGLSRHRAMMRYVDYSRAERDCERLAAKLLECYSRRELAEFVFTAIPRGGLIVLGILSYMLNLQRTQIDGPLRANQALFIVDDCALSGARFRGFLAQTAAERVVFGHLYSHPELRRALRQREPRLERCLAAHDLLDHSSEQFPDPAARRAWRDHWHALERGGEVWHGQPDLICFPWSEPTRVFWNPATEKVEEGWRLLPPHRCLKNWAALGLPPRVVAKRAWQVAPAVMSASYDGVLWLCEAETERIFSLTGVEIDMWAVLAGYGDVEVGVEYLLAKYRAGAQVLRRDLAAFADALSAAGLLERIDESDDAVPTR
jgi:hypothetical protein